jgi:hypothetical protein
LLNKSRLIVFGMKLKLLCTGYAGPAFAFLPEQYKNGKR